MRERAALDSAVPAPFYGFINDAVSARDVVEAALLNGS